LEGCTSLDEFRAARRFNPALRGSLERESFGSMNKSFNPGRAAVNGLFAAILASKNFTSILAIRPRVAGVHIPTGILL
jgi:2-methylcitrate dehydratase PrpD